MPQSPVKQKSCGHKGCGVFPHRKLLLSPPLEGPANDNSVDRSLTSQDLPNRARAENIAVLVDATLKCRPPIITAPLQGAEVLLCG